MKTGYYIKNKSLLIDATLNKLMPPAKKYPQLVHQAMRYAIKGGKRIRPTLCIACAEAAGASDKKALKAACAIEMVHTYSLVHDDLPSMDNDDYRRGRLTCHRRFGTAAAILAGDALLTLAFNVLADATVSSATNARIIKELSRAAGTLGMIGGQVIDISSARKDRAAIEYINIHKTGALIAASCKVGAIIAGANKKTEQAMMRYGEHIGLAFQIIDDILDSEGVLNITSPKRAYEDAALLVRKARSCIAHLGKRAAVLNGIADFILERKG